MFVRFGIDDDRHFRPISGYLQNGWVRDEDARRRVDAGEANRQNIPTNGQKQGWEAFPRRVHRGR